MICDAVTLAEHHSNYDRTQRRGHGCFNPNPVTIDVTGVSRYIKQGNALDIESHFRENNIST